MKILYRGNFNDGTGWAKSSTYMALALESAGHDVYCQEVKYRNVHVCLEPRIYELLEKKSDTYDLVVHHVLPTEYVKYGNVKNVGFFMCETLTLNNEYWTKNIKKMDEIWVPDQTSFNVINNISPNTKVKKVPLFFNLDNILSARQTYIPEIQNSYNFLFVGENIERKNIQGLIIAFQSEFDYNENVSLIIKTNSQVDIQSINERIKKHGRKKNIYVHLDRMAESELYSLMKSCHAFVTASRGETWCYPAAEMQALGRPIIYTENTGIEEFANPNTCYRTAATEDQCYGAVDTLEDLCTYQDTWMNPHILSLRKNMRQCYVEFAQGKSTIQKNMSIYHYANAQQFVRRLLS